MVKIIIIYCRDNDSICSIVLRRNKIYNKNIDEGEKRSMAIKYLSAKSDIIFKMIFGNSKNIEILTAFLK